MDIQSIEVEIKSLLGSEENAKKLKEEMMRIDSSCHLIGKNSQLNHYFIGGEVSMIRENLSKLVLLEEQDRFLRILFEGKDISFRTRKADKEVLFVMKASIDDTTSSNGTARIEFESKMTITIDELDTLLLRSGCSYQAKWSRDREEYEMVDGTHICIDRNAGYGYVAEFERVVSEGVSVDKVKGELRELMKSCGVEELPQDRLERMFAYYNRHWQEYYGTEKTFTIE